jgi:hypothetical protein
MSKSIFKSKTFWVNAITLAAGMVACIAGSDLIVEYPQIVALMGVLQGAVNIALRLVTSQPIK